MKANVIYNEDCRETMKHIGQEVDVILTSPFYNTNKKAGKSRTLKTTKVKEGQYDYVRYDGFVDNLTNEEYDDFTVEIFNGFDKVLKPNGCVLYNISYGSENTEGMFTAINAIITRTNFTIVDVIIWKKRTAFPNSISSNKLTRICEFVFVLCRKNELLSFHSNKKVLSTRPNGQKMYESIYTLVEAKNNDGACPLNKATFSTELVLKLLSIYAPVGGVVYDPFMGSGTTAVGCVKYGCRYIGSEISKAQCEYAQKRIDKENISINLFEETANDS